MKQAPQSTLAYVRSAWKAHFLPIALAAGALGAAAAGAPQEVASTPAHPIAAAPEAPAAAAAQEAPAAAPTVEEAKAFLGGVDKDLRRL
jgi:hypothetical protein